MTAITKRKSLAVDWRIAKIRVLSSSIATSKALTEVIARVDTFSQFDITAG